MGIRFLCPNGHKLHVKDFQAGRRGVCPYCGISVDIPLSSTRESSKGKGNGHKQYSEDKDAINLNAISPDNVPTDGGAGSFTSTRQDKEIELSAPLNRSIDVPRAPVPLPVPETKKTDPLEESPQSLWYVRPASGGQYGPASAEIMKSWLDEGRVADDSMVWREGWSDWKDAAEVFEQLTPTKLNFNLSAPSKEKESKKESNASKSSRKKEKAEKNAVQLESGTATPSPTAFNWKDPKLIAIIVEGVVIIGLIIGLILK